MNNQTDLFSCDGSECNTILHYQQLPENIESRFPMRGTKNILSSPTTSNNLYLPHATVAYYFLESSINTTYSLGNWVDTGYYGEFLGNGENWKIFKRLMAPGLHIMESKVQVLLFTKSGNSLKIKTKDGNFFTKLYPSLLKIIPCLLYTSDAADE